MWNREKEDSEFGTIVTITGMIILRTGQRRTLCKYLKTAKVGNYGFQKWIKIIQNNAKSQELEAKFAFYAQKLPLRYSSQWQRMSFIS